MSDIRELIQQEIDGREAEIVGFEMAIEEARGFVIRLRQALAVLNGDNAAVSQPAASPGTDRAQESLASAPEAAAEAPRKPETGKRDHSTAATRKELPETKCGCGRPGRHPGRCAFRRGLKQQEGRSETAPPPLRAKNFQKQSAGAAVGATVSPSICPKCGGPMGRSPYANCRSCMGPQSLKAEKEIQPSVGA
jgi:hypothetical protein